MPKYTKGQSGNPNGRPLGSVNEAKAELKEALKLGEQEHKVSFLKSYVARAYTSDPMAIALLKKIVPDLTEGDFGDETLKTFGDIIKKAINADKQKS